MPLSFTPIVRSAPASGRAAWRRAVGLGLMAAGLSLNALAQQPASRASAPQAGSMAIPLFTADPRPSPMGPSRAASDAPSPRQAESQAASRPDHAPRANLPVPGPATDVALFR